jgi:hypothetical protein
MSKYLGYVRVIAFKDFGAHVSKYQPYIILDKEVIQFNHTVPLMEDKVLNTLSDHLKFTKAGVVEKKDPDPHEWLSEYMDCLEYDLDDLLEEAGEEIKEKEFFEIKAMVNINDTSGWTDCGWEYDSEAEYHEVSVRKFKLEDLKNSYYYGIKAIASWIEQTIGLEEGQTTEDIEKDLQENGFEEYLSIYEEENYVEENNIS